MFFLPQLFSSVLFLAVVLVIAGKQRRFNRGNDGNGDFLPGRTSRLHLGVVLLALLLITGGYFSSLWRGRVADRQMREELKDRARDVVQTLDIKYAVKLAFAPEDENLPEYRRISSCLAMIAGYPDIGFNKVYTLKVKSGGFFFGPGGYMSGDPFFSPPGTLYKNPPAELADVFGKKKPLTAGPYTDENGTFVSGFAPLTDPLTGEIILIAGINMDASAWRAAILKEQSFPAVFTFLLLLVLFGGKALLEKRCWLPEERQWRLRYLEASIVLAAGFLLTFFAARIACRAESRLRGERFFSFARTISGAINNSLREAADTLHLLEGFFLASDYVDSKEFDVFTEPFTSQGILHAAAWVPEVPAKEARAFEKFIRGQGLKGFYIYRDRDNPVPVPSSGSGVYYPALYRSLQGEANLLLGYDIGFEPLRRAAMEESKNSGLCTATETVEFFGSGRKISGMVAYRFIDAGKQKGFIAAALSFENIVRHAVFTTGAQDVGMAVEMVKLGEGVPPELLAASSAETSVVKYGGRYNFRSFSAPVFAFGKTYAVNVIPGSAYLSANRLKDGAAVAFAGIFLSAALAFIVFFLSTRQTFMEREIRSRTAELKKEIEEREKAEAELREKEAFFRMVLDNLPVGVGVNTVFQPVTFEYINDNFARFYRTTGEKILNPGGFWEAAYEDPVFRGNLKKKVEEDCASGDPSRMEWEDVPVTRKGEKTTFISARNIKIPGGKGMMISTVWDVTERKEAEDQIKRHIGELERWHYITLGREKRIRELKREVNELMEKIGRPPRYKSADEE